jgi:hypothetical protein
MKPTRFFALITIAYASPCDAVARHYLSIPQNLECEMIKWRLLLYKDPRNQSPTQFELHYTYGMTKPGTEGFMNGGFTKQMKGQWTLSESNSRHAGLRVYRLTPESAKDTISILKLDENVLHLLDLQGKLMIGNAGFSYTLNKL